MKCCSSRRFSRTGRIVALVIAAIIGSGAVACHFGGGPEKRAEFMVGRIKSKLDLTEDQGRKLDAIKEEALAFHRANREQRDKDRAWIKEQILGERLDTQAALGLLNERRAAGDRKVAELLGKVADLHQTLSKEQKEKLAEMLEHFARHHEG